MKFFRRRLENPPQSRFCFVVDRGPVINPMTVEGQVHLETPSPLTPGGRKGMGEGGTIGAPGAIAKAVADAVKPLGVAVTSLPILPETLARSALASPAVAGALVRARGSRRS
jgi:carbon-monoxide dehydrogenase large subunit